MSVSVSPLTEAELLKVKAFGFDHEYPIDHVLGRVRDAREDFHVECDCVPDLGPSHCHMCGDENGGMIVGWAQALNLHAAVSS